MSDLDRKNCQLALAAPTGKAAANLQSSLKKSLGDVEFGDVAAKTLHALLGIGRQEPQKLAADIIVVDEESHDRCQADGSAICFSEGGGASHSPWR